MSFLQFRTICAFLLCLFLSSFFSGHLCALAPASEPPVGQAASAKGGLTGLLTDRSGAVVAEASVGLTDASGASYDTTTNNEGIYELKELTPRAYALKGVAKGFDPFTQKNVQITPNQVPQANVSLTVHDEPEKDEVTGQATNQPTQAVPAKGATGGLTGMVTDPSGAGVPKATVRLTDASGASYDAPSNWEGIYDFKALPAGIYSLKAVAKGFALFTQENVQITANQVQQVNISLMIHIEEQKVEVTDESTKVDVDPANNAGEVVMKGKDLEALSDDPDELQSELQALAGPSAGPNGGQIYIDGFTAGQLPPKASIREIRINQNPFSSEYDKLGYGRIEILTKAGTDQLHGQFWVMGNTTALNSKNPFEGAGPPPSYYSTQYEGHLSGSLGKKVSFFCSIERRNLNDFAVVDAPYVDPTTLQITTFSGAFPNPRTRTNVSQRFDFQVTPHNTLTGRYQYWRNNEQSDGVGGFSLPAVGYNALNTEHTFQMTDTQVLGARTINETRFQYLHQDRNQNPLIAKPTISIQGAFTTGGNSGGLSLDTQNRYELQNITYFNVGKHAIKYGGRLRATRDDYLSTAQFNSTYVFGPRQRPNCTSTPTNNCQLTGIQAYQIMLQAIAPGDTEANQLVGIANGGGASYYVLNSSPSGVAQANVRWFDGALFFQDDWRIRPNVTLSTGLRYETQNDLGDHADFAPRVGIAWALGGGGNNRSPKTVLRAGYGIFYDRFSSDLVLQQKLQNGMTQQQFLVKDPRFFAPDEPRRVPPNSVQPQVVYIPNPALRTPYILQAGATVERQLNKYANLSVTYLNSRGVHQLYTNATPPPPVVTPPPVGFSPAIVYQYQAGGIFRQNQLIVNSRVQMGARLSLWGYYTLNYSNSDTSGAGYIPSIPCGGVTLPAGSPCGINEDYGRASFDVRHRVFVGGSVSMPWGLRASPFLVAQSGSPFNITTGQDLYGINTFNTRPTIGTCGAPGVISTVYGCFNEQTQPGQIGIPINEETGPTRFTLNMRFSKTFGFGEKKETPGGGGGPRGGTFGRAPHEHGGGMFGGNPSDSHYNLTFSINARNVLNKVNVSNPIGNLSSPLFGQSNGLVGGPFSFSPANRLIYLQCLFNF